MIYLLEDDDSIRELVCYSLNKTGNEARGFALPSEFFAAVEKELPSLVLLDVMLPEQDGISVLHSLRSAPITSRIPVIMLTAKGSEFDKVTALDGGADDYVTKPFGVMELIARVKALLRRSAVNEMPDRTYSHGSITVSTLTHEVRSNGEEISLTYKEFELLCLLISSPGTVFTRDQILQQIWGYEFDGENGKYNIVDGKIAYK